jgi:hypothetical protein
MTGERGFWSALHYLTYTISLLRAAVKSTERRVSRKKGEDCRDKQVRDAYNQ